MGSYQNTPNLKIKKWHIGVIALASLSFTQPEPKEKRTSEIKLPKESEKALKVRNLELAKKGIDLNKRHLEVKKLFLKHCAKMCLDNRCDPEDVLQEVYKGHIPHRKTDRRHIRPAQFFDECIIASTTGQSTPFAAGLKGLENKSGIIGQPPNNA